jgi:hypothetical protein
MEDNARGRDCVSSAIGEAIPRRAIFDITNSGVGLAVQDLAKAHDLVERGRPDASLIEEKLDSFFFITADYAFGASLEA